MSSAAPSPPALAAPASGRGGPTRWGGARLHAVTMVLAGLYLLWTARGDQFLADDWAFIARLEAGTADLGWLLEPHNEHWTLLPKLVYLGVHAVAGAGSVWPYLVVTLALHLVLCHLLYRLAVAGGADAGLAALGATLFAVYATGVENVLWAFQTGLVGNLVLGCLTMLELTRRRPRGWVVALWSVANVVTSGISLVFLGLTAIAVVVTRRPRSLLALVPAAGLALTWYLVLAPRVAGDPRGTAQLVLLPVYWLLGLGNALVGLVPLRSADDAVFPTSGAAAGVVVLGAPVLLALAVLAWRRVDLRPGPVVTVLALGAPTFVLMTSLSRVSYGVGTALLSRYAYVATAFLLPWLVVLLSRWTALRSTGRVAATGLVAVLVLANGVSWWFVSHAWVEWTRTNARVMTAGVELVRSGTPVYADSPQTPEFAFLTPRQVGRLEIGRPAGAPDPQDELSARLAARTRITPDGTGPGAGCGPPSVSIDLTLGGAPRRFVVDRSGAVTTVLVGPDGVRSHERSSTLDGGSHRLTSLEPSGRVVVWSADGSAILRACSD